MIDRTLIARVEEEGAPEGTVLVRSPAVGIVDAVPPQGSFIDAGRLVLYLRILGRAHSLLLPRGVQGWVTERLVDRTFVPVEFDQPLLRLSRGPTSRAPEDGAEGARPEGRGTEEGLVPVRSPSEGVFYRGPNPQSPPYVTEGSEVSSGTVLGLVEVMKCFYQITYGGPELPAKGTVVQVLAENAAEVVSEQELFLIRPGD